MSLEFLSLSHRNSPGKTSLAAKSKEKRLYSQATMYQSIPKLPICNLHISHNTPCLPPKTLHNLCFKFLLGITVALREIRQIAYAKLWGENKVYMYYGRYANGKFLPLWKLRASQFLKNFGQISILCWPFRWSNAPPINTSKSLTHRQSAKTADWLVDNDVIWPVLRNCACANLGKLKIEHGGWAWESDAKLQGPTRLLFVEKEIIKYSKKP